MVDLPAEDGWYRRTENGWEPVGDHEAEAERAIPLHGLDLVYVSTSPPAIEEPLF